MMGWLKIPLAALSGVALAMCFAPFDWSWLVWGWMWLLLPLLWTVSQKRARRKAFGLGWIAGMGFWVINLKWLGTVTWPGAVALSAYLSLYFAIFAAFAAGSANPWRKEYPGVKTIRDRVRQSLRSLGYAALLGGFWCGLEWVRGWLMTGFGWNGLGVTFAKNLILAQNAEYVGVIGLSFLPVFMSAVAVQTARRFYQQFRANEVKMLHWDFASALLVIMVAFTSGTVRLSTVTNAPKIKGRVLLMQQDIPQIAGKTLWDSEKAISGFIELMELAFKEIEEETGKAFLEAKGKEVVVEIKTPDLVIWPESAFSGNELPFRKFENQPTEGWPQAENDVVVAKSLGEFTFIAGVTEVEGKTDVDPETKVYNSMLVDRPNAVRQTYQKNHLVILGEYIPDLPFLHDLYKNATGVDFVLNTSPGGRFEPLKVNIGANEVSMIPSVCFEDTVPRVTRKFVRNEPQVLVNITNDGWFQRSEGSIQHYRNALFRSIELRRPTVRCANQGVTGVVTVAGSLVDPYTKEKRHLVDEDGSHFHRGYLLASVYIPSEGGITLYAAFGDWFAATGLLVGLLWMITSYVTKRVRQGADPLSKG